MASANTSGGVMGKMIDAQSIVVAGAATQQVGREAAIFQAVFKHSLALVAIVGPDRHGLRVRPPRVGPQVRRSEQVELVEDPASGLTGHLSRRTGEGGSSASRSKIDRDDLVIEDRRHREPEAISLLLHRHLPSATSNSHLPGLLPSGS